MTLNCREIAGQLAAGLTVILPYHRRGDRLAFAYVMFDLVRLVPRHVALHHRRHMAVLTLERGR